MPPNSAAVTIANISILWMFLGVDAPGIPAGPDTRRLVADGKCQKSAVEARRKSPGRTPSRLPFSSSPGILEEPIFASGSPSASAGST